MFLQANIKDFKYYVRQRIGVYCKDADWMEMAFQTILKCYDECLIQEVRNSRYNKIIEFKNGDMIKFVPAVEGARGNKFNKIFLQPGIDREIYTTVIKPCLFNRGYAFVMDENDFYINADYYYIKEEELEKEVKRNDVIREI